MSRGCQGLTQTGGTGRHLAATTPQYILNPVAIGIRGDPFGDRPNEADVRMPMANADPRSRAMFGAAYFVGYLANLGLQDGTQVDAVALGDAMGIYMRKRYFFGAIYM